MKVLNRRNAVFVLFWGLIMYLVPSLPLKAFSNVDNDSFQGALLSNNNKQQRKWIISAQDVVKNRERIQLIDTRPKAEFEKFHIPGSLNIPLYSLKSKKYLKNKSVILVTDSRFRLLEQECGKLQSLWSKDVYILEGGLNYWYELGHTLKGDPFAILNLGILSPQDFWIDKDYEDWIIILIDQQPSPDKKPLFPAAHYITFNEPDQLTKKIKKILTPKKKKSPSNILFIDKDGRGFREIKKILHGQGFGNIFYLAGGLIGFEKFLSDQEKMLSQNKKSLDKCNVCP